jgi:hypothetical protein
MIKNHRLRLSSFREIDPTGTTKNGRDERYARGAEPVRPETMAARKPLQRDGVSRPRRFSDRCLLHDNVWHASLAAGGIVLTDNGGHRKTYSRSSCVLSSVNPGQGNRSKCKNRTSPPSPNYDRFHRFRWSLAFVRLKRPREVRFSRFTPRSRSSDDMIFMMDKNKKNTTSLNLVWHFILYRICYNV